MTLFPPLRPTETGSADIEPAAVLRGSSPVRTAAAVAGAAAVFLAIVLLAGVGRLDSEVPQFLANALGPEKAEAPMERTPTAGVDVRIHDRGYSVSHWGKSVSVASEDVGGAEWRRHVHGVTRETDFGAETILIGRAKTESFLTVAERQGEKTWRWRLASRLQPRLDRDGAVTFLDPTSHRVTSIVMDAVRILDSDGKDVTPDGLRWGLEEGSDGWILTLKLDDADLPLPYVIDPAITHRTDATATTAVGTSLVVNVPTGVQANDLLVAHIARVGNAAINTPTGWTAAGGTNNGNFIRQATYYRVAGSSEPASYTWTWTGTQPAAGGMSAYYGVKASAPLDVVGAATTANNTTSVTAPALTTTTNDALVLAFFSSNTNSTYSTAAGMSERYEIGITVAVSVASDDMTQAVAGSTGAKTSTASTSGRVVGHQVSFHVDDVAPTGSLNNPGSPLAGTVSLAGNAADTDSAVASVLFQRSPADAGTWTSIGAADTTSPYAASFDTTAVTDGLYDLRVVITDVAGNVTNSTIIEDRRVDNTAPASTTTFPAASGTYNVAGWEAGCITIGLCGTYSDGGSGVSQVQVSIRQGAGSYWNGSGFSSGTEVWNAATLSAGSWSYPFAAAGFPAAGSYTVRVRAVDSASNTESPSSRTFTIDPAAPETTIDSSPSTPTGSTSADFGFSSSEGGSTFECRLDGGSWSACTSPRSYTSLTEGTHTFDVRATDAAGNTDGSPSSFTWLVDTTAPSSTTSFPAVSGEYNAAGWTAGCATAGLCGTYSDGSGSGVAEVQVSIRQGAGSYWDGSGFASGTEVWNTTSLAAGSWSLAFPASNLPADGTYTVRVRAVDTVGNAETPSSRSFTYDTTAPSALIAFAASGSSYTNAAWNAGCATSGFCGTHSDSGSGVQSVQVSVLRVSTGLYWEGSSFSSGAETFLGASLTGGDWSLAFPASSFPADGAYTVRVRAVDTVGNTGTPTSRTFGLDTTDPTGSLTAPADGAALRGSSVAVSSDSADAGSGVDQAEFQQRPTSGSTWTTIDTDTTTPYTVDWDTTPLTDGDYDLRVRTTDHAGNTTTSPTRTVTVDNTAPSVATLDALPAAIRNGQELSGTGADAASGVDSLLYLYCAGASCTPSSAIGSSTTGPAFSVAWTSQPADGDVRVLVRVSDRAGNSLDSAVQNVEIDNTGPTGALTAPADAATVDSTVVVSSDSADAGSGVDQAEFQQRPTSGSTWTTIDTDTTTPYTVDWDTTPLTDGDYDLRVRTTDHAGNTTTSPTRTVTVDNTAPTVTLVSPTGFVNAGAADPLTVTAATPDGDVESVEFFSCSDPSTGCSGGSWTSLGADSSAPYSASWPIDPDGNRALRAVAADGTGKTGSDVVDVTIDRTTPTGSLTSPADASFVTASVAVSSDSADAGSGVDQAEFQQRPTSGSTWTTIDTDTTTPYTVDWDTTPLTDGDYDLRVRTTDHAGNTTTSPTRTVTVDNTAPSTPVVSLSESSPFAYVSGSEIFVDTDESGSYDVEATSSDAASGIDKFRFPGPTDDSTSPYQASYGFGDLSGPQAVTAYNGVGLTASSQFTVTPDTAEPSGGSIDYPDGYDADGDVTVAVDAGTDVLSGVELVSAVLERRTASLSAGACDPFAGSWTTVTSPDTVASSLCAQYRYRVSDRVGNEAVYTSANVVKVDLVDPATPVLTLVESSPYAHAVGTEIFVNTTASGSFDVEAATSDAVAGIDKVSFPGGVDDANAPYTATYDFGDLSGTETVTAHDRAGNVASADFEVTEDVSAPATTDDSASIGSGWQTAPVTVTLTPADGGAGVATTYYTTDGSVPTTSSEEGTSVDLTADGVYVVRYLSVDNVGNAEPVQTATATIRIDQTSPDAPSISLFESSPYAYASADQIFVNSSETGTYDVSVTSFDAGSGIDKVVFPGGVEDFTSPYSTSYDLDDLSGLQTVTVHDAAGLTAADTFTVTPDTAAPSGGSVDYPDGYDADGDVTITVDAGTDALAGVDASSGVVERQTSALMDGVCDPFAGGWSAVSSPDTVADSTCARYRYRVSDRVSNEAIYTLPSSTVKVDLTAPQTTIDVAPGDPSSDASPSFEFSSSEGASTFDCRLDGGAWAACSSPENYAGLADGGHTFEVRATDAAGNVDATPPSHAWTIDTEAPNTSLDVVPPDPSDDDSPSFEFSANEGGVDLECRLDGGAWAPCTSPQSYTGLADGSHTFDVRATDAAGNVEGSPATHTWTVDTVAPDSSFTVVPPDPTADSTPTFEFTASEGGSSFQCRLDGGAWGACTSPETVGPLADGSHSFDVRATDAAGNEETTPESYTWVVDAPPSVSITQPSGFVNGSDSDPYTVRATSPDGDVSGIEFFSCSDASVDCAGGAWVSLGTDATAPYEASWPLDADGNRALRAVATDTGSATGADVVNVTIDRTAPATTIDAAPSDPTTSTEATFEFSSSEGSSTFECRLDGGAWNACTSPREYTGLSDGYHTFDVRALDDAGNLDPSPAASGWTVDTAAPETTLDATPSDPTSVSAPNFEFSASEAGATFECRLDGDPWDPCLSPHGYTGLADGSHAFRVRGTDPAGNVDSSPAEHTWTIDSTAPGGGLTDPGQYLGGTVALVANASDGGAGVQSVDFQVSLANAGSWTSIGADTGAPYGADWDTAALADGAYDLRVVVTDNAGNSGSSPVIEDRIVDNTAPTKPGGFKGIVYGSTFSLSWKPASDTSGVVSAYRIYANGALISTVGGSSLSAPMGAFKLTDRRAFQVAAVDGAGNVGPLSVTLKVVPKLTELTVAAAKKALTKRGLKAGKIRYRTSASVPKGRVIAGTAKGLRPAGAKIGLIVSRG